MKRFTRSVVFPVQRLDAIPATAAEQIQCVGKRIQRELLLNQISQAVDPTAQVRITAGDIHLFCAGKVAQNNFKIRSTVSIVAASAPV